jgi:DNA-binding NarL/FixJ family response regulator
MHKKKTILHIDDNVIFMNSVKSVLKQSLDVNYDHVCDKYEAYHYLRNKMPDVIIVDLMLENDYDPDPGVKLVEEFSKKYKGIDLVVMTGNPDNDIKNHLLELTPYYETKGSDPMSFQAKMKRIIENKH